MTNEREYDEICEKCGKWGCTGGHYCSKRNTDEREIFNTFGETMKLIHESIRKSNPLWPQ